MENIFVISLTTSIVILIILATSPWTDKRYSARWRYLVWLIIALRLVIPFSIRLPSAPITVTQPPREAMIVFRTQGSSPIEYFPDDSYIELGHQSMSSADYSPIMTFSEAVFLIWITGAILFLLYHLLIYLLFRIRIKRHLKRDSKNLFVCSKVCSPMMLGFFRPIILLPETDYSEEEKSVIIKHEMTHMRRGDIWYKLLLVVANAVHWFNPVIYLMVRRANRDLEYSCDDIVVAGMDTEFKKNYALTILKSIRRDTK